MIIVTGDIAKEIYKEMRKTQYVTSEIYDYEIPCGIVAIDRKTGDIALAKRKFNQYVAVKGQPAEYLEADIKSEIPYVKDNEITDMLMTARDVIYKN